MTSAAEVIDRKAQLEPLGAGLTRTSGADSGIVDQDVEPIHRRLGRVGETTHLGECREVGRKEIRRAAVGLDVGDDASTSLRITAMHQHARAGLSERASDEPADPVCRTGDQCRLSGQLFHLGLLTWLDERDYFGIMRAGCTAPS